MAKLTGPMLSLEAAGQVGGSLIYQTWRGRPYARKLTTPQATPNAKQLGIRHILGLCSSVWPGMPQSRKDEWQAYKPGMRISPINKYIGYNIDRAVKDLPPRLHPGTWEPFDIHSNSDVDLLTSPTHNSLTLTPPQLLLNRSFTDYTGTQDDQTSDSFSHWSVSAAGDSYVESSADAFQALSSAAIYKGTAAAPALWQQLTLTLGQQYRFSFWTKGDDDQPIRYGIYQAVAPNWIIPLTSPDTAAHIWQPVSALFTPQDITTVYPHFYSSTSNDTLGYLDHTSLHADTPLVWEDDWAWLIYRKDKPAAPSIVSTDSSFRTTNKIIAALPLYTPSFHDTTITPGQSYEYSIWIVDPNGGISEPTLGF